MDPYDEFEKKVILHANEIMTGLIGGGGGRFRACVKQAMIDAMLWGRERERDDQKKGRK